MRLNNSLPALLVFKVLMLFMLPGYTAPKRIITLSGAITETVDALGFGKQIVAVDVTSTFPEYIKRLPRVSRNRSVSAEGLISFSPDLVIAPEGDISFEIQSQLKTYGIKLILIRQEYSPKGAAALIRKVAAVLGVASKGELLAQQTLSRVNDALARVRQSTRQPKVLFIYARGSGTMSVAGKGSNMDAIIKLAGGRNAVNDFDDFKPYTSEALVKANPDVILMFDFGLSSLGGKEEMLAMPGIKLTNAGKHQRIVTMDGQLLISFSSRLDQAILQLHALLMN